MISRHYPDAFAVLLFYHFLRCHALKTLALFREFVRLTVSSLISVMRAPMAMMKRARACTDEHE